MKQVKRMIALVLALTMTLALLAGCGGTPGSTADPGSAPAGEEALDIGLIYSNGGRGDRGINDLMYNAMERVCKENGWTYSDMENENAANVEPANRQFCEQGKDVIINFGFGCIDVVNRLAVEYPEIKFITIDAVTDELPNVKNFTFKENEGAFLVGLIAGLMTETDKVGFVGGMENEQIIGFNAGFEQGVLTANPDAEVLSAYCGATVAAFADPTKGKEIAMSHYDAGCDIIFHASGSSGQGVFQAAIDTGNWAIGVDSNQQAEAPDNIITSMLKQVDVAVEEALTEIANDEFQPGVFTYGLKEGYVGYVNDDTNAGKIPDEVVDQVAELAQKVIDGEIEVRTTME